VTHKPFFIEFAGPPAVGKTTACNLLSHELQRLGSRVALVPEAAARAPIPQLKRKWLFNAWTSCQTISQMIEHLDDNRHQFALIDRGITDSRCWMAWHRARGEMDIATHTAVRNFLCVDAWMKRQGLVFYLRATFDTALKRRGAAGRILNLKTYVELLQAYDSEILAMQGRRGGPIACTLETDQLTPAEVASWCLGHALRAVGGSGATSALQSNSYEQLCDRLRILVPASDRRMGEAIRHIATRLDELTVDQREEFWRLLDSEVAEQVNLVAARLTPSSLNAAVGRLLQAARGRAG